MESFNTAQQNTSSDGIFIQEDIISSVEEAATDKGDISLLVKFRPTEAHSFESKMYINGSFRRDANQAVVGIGSVTKVRRLLQVLGVTTDITVTKDAEGRHIHPSALAMCVGKSLLHLRYSTCEFKPDGKRKYRDYAVVYAPNTANARVKIKEEFLKDVAGNYVKNYASPSFETPVNVTAGAPVAEEVF